MDSITPVLPRQLVAQVGAEPSHHRLSRFELLGISQALSRRVTRLLCELQGIAGRLQTLASSGLYLGKCSEGEQSKHCALNQGSRSTCQADG